MKKILLAAALCVSVLSAGATEKPLSTIGLTKLKCTKLKTKFDNSLDKTELAIKLEDRKSAMKFLDESRNAIYSMLDTCKDDLTNYETDIKNITKRLNKSIHKVIK